jgi:hypothetical protein
VVTMKDIRLCWIHNREAMMNGQPFECGLWCSETDASRKELAELLGEGLEVWGPKSHWIEQRDCWARVKARNGLLPAWAMPHPFPFGLSITGPGR